MDFLSRIPRSILIAAMAVMAAIATAAAIHLGSTVPSLISLGRDPLAPGADAVDQTGEVSAKPFSSIQLDQVDLLAKEKFGPMPELSTHQELAKLSEFRGGTQSLDELERIRDIRRTQGSAAAVAAMKATRRPSAP